jgi:hypothetical protein
MELTDSVVGAIIVSVVKGELAPPVVVATMITIIVEFTDAIYQLLFKVSWRQPPAIPPEQRGKTKLGMKHQYSQQQTFAFW